ncbi:MAG: hypothetical protein ACXVX8_01655 [Blastococcus sp.]
MRWTRIGVLTAAVLALSTGVSGGVAHAQEITGTSSAAPVSPYYAPPFADECTVHRFGEGEAPDLTAYPDDPLCVEYAKRNITVDNGGAVAFLLAEPARFAIALPKCQYWQQDHWSVQVSRGDTAIVRWDGSYWFDKGTGQAAARLRGFTIEGQPAGVNQAADLVATVSPALADYLRAYGHGGSGLGTDAGVPVDPTCAR